MGGRIWGDLGDLGFGGSGILGGWGLGAWEFCFLGGIWRCWGFGFGGDFGSWVCWVFFLLGLGFGWEFGEDWEIWGELGFWGE